MEPLDFPESNRILTAPTHVKDVKNLPVYTDGTYCMSKWKPTKDELNDLNNGGCIYLTIRSGETQPPVSLSVKINHDRKASQRY